MARPRKFDPDDVLDEAMRQFWQRGYSDTSVDSLVEATGVRPGSLYNTFKGGKHALFMGSLERYSKLVVPEKMGPLEGPNASIPEIRAYFDGLVQDLSSEEGRIGCLMVNSAIELAAVDPTVSRVVSGHMDRLERNATRALRNAVKRGEAPASIDPKAKAKLLMATAMGLMVVGKTDPGKEVLETIVNTAFAGLG
jgi:TetR/AcrR family transcriptional regulator, transcriptional repressor for nem operon